MNKAVDIAIVGATGLVGSAVLERLAETDIEIGNVFPLASNDSEGEGIEFRNRRLTVHTLEQFDFSKAQIAIFCVPAEVAQSHVDRAAGQGCWVIDHSSAWRQHSDVPLVVSTINPADIEIARKQKIIACPDSAVSMLALVLHVLNDGNQVERVNVVMMRAVSDIGKIGIDELSKQSIALFNLKPIICEQFKQQIAFNVIPETSPNTYDIRRHSQSELRKITQDDALLVNTMLAHVPVFYGHSLALQLELRDTVDLQRISRLIKKSSVLHFIGNQDAQTVPTPVTHGVNQEGLFLGRLEKDETWERGLTMWVVGDNIQQGAAINSVQVTEILVKDYL